MAGLCHLVGDKRNQPAKVPKVLGLGYLGLGNGFQGRGDAFFNGIVAFDNVVGGNVGHRLISFKDIVIDPMDLASFRVSRNHAALSPNYNTDETEND